MREILFRGKRVDNGEWVEGYITEHTMISHDMQAHIGFVIECKPKDLYECEWHEVIPETVGQYTGLNDRNGDRIFEGDIVRYKWGKEREYCHVIKFEDGEFFAILVLSLDNLWKIRISGENKKFAVIGNIHDNPELLED